MKVTFDKSLSKAHAEPNCYTIVCRMKHLSNSVEHSVWKVYYLSLRADIFTFGSWFINKFGLWYYSLKIGSQSNV